MTTTTPALAALLPWTGPVGRSDEDVRAFAQLQGTAAYRRAQRNVILSQANGKSYEQMTPAQRRAPIAVGPDDLAQAELQLRAEAKISQRAHMVSYLAELIREDNLDAPDLQSVAANVDWEDSDSWYPWPGEQVRAYLLVIVEFLGESAEDLVASAARNELGWEW